MNPPLPEPFIQYEGCAPVFTEAQLLAYRDACIEMCAKDCEDESMDLRRDVMQRRGAALCANAMRKLK